MAFTTRALAVLTVVSATTEAASLEATPERQVRALMVEAIDAASGRSSGVLNGPFVDAMQTRFQTAARVTVEVTTVRRFAQPGCSRLNVRFQQAGVVTASQPTGRTQSMDVGLNYCRDGSAPTSPR